MRILYDHQVFSLERMGGMTKYYAQLMQGLLDAGHEVVLPVRASNNTYIKKILPFVQINYKDGQGDILPKLQFKGKQNLLYRYNKLKFLVNPDRYLEGVDLVHMTLYDPYMIDIVKRRNIPFVFNVYDLNHKTQQLKKGLLDIRMCDFADKGIQKLGEVANAIICVSKQTKRDLLKYYPSLDAQKIQIIYHSIDLKNIASHQSPVAGDEDALLTTDCWQLGSKYILFIGKRKADYKNFRSFVEAVAPVLGTDLKLVCLGHEEFDAGEVEMLNSLKLEKFVIHMGGDEQVKYDLLAHAQVFVFPSYAEGFGIPILEAWAAGCPVLCSNISVFMEIGGGAALYFDPHSIDNMRELIGGVIKNNDIQENLRHAGYERVKSFDKYVEINKIIELYEKVITF